MSEFDKQMVGGRGGGYGLDAELARKQAANYDYNAETSAREWIEGVVGQPFEGPFGSSLKDGILLCKLVNCIAPGSVKKINESKMPFKQMENVSNFLKACRSLGVAEHSLFETVDLYEEKDLGLVVKCLYALGSTVQATVPEFEGPHLGARIAKANKREWTPEQLKQGRLNAAYSKQSQGSSETMERKEIVKTGISMGAEYAGPSVAANALVQSSMGSYGIMERSEVVKTGITMGSEYSGPSMCANTISQSSLGSYGIMDRPEVVKTGITMGSEYSGPSCAANAVTQSSLGSYGIMDRAEVTKTGITAGADYSGPSCASNDITKSSLGSYGVMERATVPKTGITAGADNCGPSVDDGTHVIQTALGSFGIMERPEISKTGITFGADASGLGAVEHTESPVVVAEEHADAADPAGGA